MEMQDREGRRWCVDVRYSGGKQSYEVYCGDERTARVVYRALVRGSVLYPEVCVRLEHRAPTPPAAHPLLRFRHRVPR